MFKRSSKCPYLRGAEAEAVCDVTCDCIINIEYADIRLCGGRHYEACAAYRDALRSLLFEKYFKPGGEPSAVLTNM